ncbi:MAG: hypothetical protein DIU82_04000, partial [Bacillota bacterium]
MRLQRSRELFQRAVQHITGGVNSPSRSFAPVQMDHPIYMRRGQGAYLWDEDGNRYITTSAPTAPSSWATGTRRWWRRSPRRRNGAPSTARPM